MTVRELIAQLKKMPQSTNVKMESGDYLDDPDQVEYEESRDYVIIRSK